MSRSSASISVTVWWPTLSRKVGPVELEPDSPKFPLKKFMINVFSHLPQQVALWKGLSRGFPHGEKHHRAGQVHECLLAPGKPSRRKSAKGHTLASCQYFAVGKHYVEGLPLL